MKFYLIKILKKEDGFDKLFEALRIVGKFVMDNKEIIIKSDLSIDDINNIFEARILDSDKIDIKEIIDTKSQVEGKHNIDWIEKEKYLDRSKPINDEYNERISAMSDILEKAIKIKNGGEPSRWQQIKSKMMGRKKPQ
jgi:hypothetical protein